jgi:hypothetical protein
VLRECRGAEEEINGIIMERHHILMASPIAILNILDELLTAN